MIIILYILTMLLVLHGLSDWIGTVLFGRAMAGNGLFFRTTLFKGNWDLGENGVIIYGGLWIVAACIFFLAIVARVCEWGCWKDVLILAAILAMINTILDWKVDLNRTPIDR